jgi:hypothetical protein
MELVCYGIPHGGWYDDFKFLVPTACFSCSCSHLNSMDLDFLVLKATKLQFTINSENLNSCYLHPLRLIVLTSSHSFYPYQKPESANPGNIPTLSLSEIKRLSLVLSFFPFQLIFWYSFFSFPRIVWSLCISWKTEQIFERMVYNAEVQTSRYLFWHEAYREKCPSATSHKHMACLWLDFPMIPWAVGH